LIVNFDDRYDSFSLKPELDFLPVTNIHARALLHGPGNAGNRCNAAADNHFPLPEVYS
jgi:hypothetical protein